eukprot:1014148-Amphidinium_carterae.3
MGLVEFAPERPSQDPLFGQFKSMRTAPTASWNYDATKTMRMYSEALLLMILGCTQNPSPLPSVEGLAEAPQQQEEEERNVDENVESELMQVFREHENDRVEGEGNPIMQHFAYSLIRGQWQKKGVGRDVYGWRISARDSTVVHDFLSAFSLNLSASFEYSV